MNQTVRMGDADCQRFWKESCDARVDCPGRVDRACGTRAANAATRLCRRSSDGRRPGYRGTIALRAFRPRAVPRGSACLRASADQRMAHPARAPRRSGRRSSPRAPAAAAAVTASRMVAARPFMKTLRSSLSPAAVPASGADARGRNPQSGHDWQEALRGGPAHEQGCLQARAWNRREDGDVGERHAQRLGALCEPLLLCGSGGVQVREDALAGSIAGSASSRARPAAAAADEAQHEVCAPDRLAGALGQDHAGRRGSDGGVGRGNCQAPAARSAA